MLAMATISVFDQLNQEIQAGLVMVLAMCQKNAILVYIRYVAMRLYILSWRKDVGTIKSHESSAFTFTSTKRGRCPESAPSKELLDSLLGSFLPGLNTHFFICLPILF